MQFSGNIGQIVCWLPSQGLATPLGNSGSDTEQIILDRQTFELEIEQRYEAREKQRVQPCCKEARFISLAQNYLQHSITIPERVFLTSDDFFSNVSTISKSQG